MRNFVRGLLIGLAGLAVFWICPGVAQHLEGWRILSWILFVLMIVASLVTIGGPLYFWLVRPLLRWISRKRGIRAFRAGVTISIIGLIGVTLSIVLSYTIPPQSLFNAFALPLVLLFLAMIAIGPIWIREARHNPG